MSCRDFCTEEVNVVENEEKRENRFEEKPGRKRRRRRLGALFRGSF